MKKHQNLFIVIINGLWLMLSGLNESGLLDMLPFEDETFNKWFKWVVAFIVMVVNAVFFNYKRTVGNRPNDRTVGNRPDDRLPDCPDDCACTDSCVRNK